MRKFRLTAIISVIAIAAGVLAILPATSAGAVENNTVPGNVAPSYQTNAPVRAIQSTGGVIYIGGDFTSVRPPGTAPGTGEVARNYLVALNSSTGNPISFAPSFNGAVKSLALSPDGATLYVGGDFTTVNGTARNRAAAFNLSTGALLPWNPNANGRVTAHRRLEHDRLPRRLDGPDRQPEPQVPRCRRRHGHRRGEEHLRRQRPERRVRPRPGQAERQALRRRRLREHQRRRRRTQGRLGRREQRSSDPAPGQLHRSPDHRRLCQQPQGRQDRRQHRLLRQPRAPVAVASTAPSPPTSGTAPSSGPAPASAPPRASRSSTATSTPVPTPTTAPPTRATTRRLRRGRLVQGLARHLLARNAENGSALVLVPPDTNGGTDGGLGPRTFGHRRHPALRRRRVHHGERPRQQGFARFSPAVSTSAPARPLTPSPRRFPATRSASTSSRRSTSTTPT